MRLILRPYAIRLEWQTRRSEWNVRIWPWPPGVSRWTRRPIPIRYQHVTVRLDLTQLTARAQRKERHDASQP